MLEDPEPKEDNMSPEQLQDFKERLEKAAHTLREMSHGQHAEGVSLALSILNEYQQEKKQ